MWTTLVSSSGIPINAGDQLSLEAAAAVSGTVMELKGKASSGTVVDNEVAVDLAFWIVDCGPTKRFQS